MATTHIRMKTLMHGLGLVLLLASTSKAVSFSRKIVGEYKREIKSWIDADGNAVMISYSNSYPQIISDSVNNQRRKRSVSSLNSAQITASVDKHNTLRKGEGASNMRFMVWNAELASMAQSWADNCDFVHGQPSGQNHSVYSGIGQNLHMSTATSLDVNSAIQAWFDEKSDYTFDTKGCSRVCGHYTQVVWADTYEVGCGTRTCTPLRDSDTNKQWATGTIYVCNYGPTGNYQGQSPYNNQGGACTTCSTGKFNCFDTMCRDDCTGVNCTCEGTHVCKNCANVTSECSCSCADGWRGNMCTVPCADNHSNCNNDWSSAQCSFTTVQGHCPVMCNKCNPKTSSTPQCAEESGAGVSGARSSWITAVLFSMLFSLIQY